MTIGLEWTRTDYDVKSHTLIAPTGVTAGTADLDITTNRLTARSNIVF